MKRIKKFIAVFTIVFASLCIFNVFSMNDNSQVVVQAAVKKTNKGNIYATKGQKFKITVTGAKGKITYSSSNKKVASVDSKGIITSKAKGTATVVAKASNCYFYWKCNVEQPKLSFTSKTLDVGKKATLKLNGTKRKYTFSSSNTKVATVNSKGVITAKASGSATINVTIANSTLKVNKFQCKITVPNYLSKISYTKSTFNHGIVYIVENKNTVPVNVTLYTEYYNNDTKVDSINDINYCLSSGCKAVLFTKSSKTCNEVKSRLGVSRSPYSSYTKSIKFVQNTFLNSNGKISFAVKNDSNKLLTKINGTVVFSKNGKIVDCVKVSMNSVRKAGSTATISCNIPKVAGTNSLIDFDEGYTMISVDYAYLSATNGVG